MYTTHTPHIPGHDTRPSICTLAISKATRTVLEALYPQPATRNPSPYTLHPRPNTRHSKANDEQSEPHRSSSGQRPSGSLAP
jgi:hypothetical protein